jgi:hypothetical protein
LDAAQFARMNYVDTRTVQRWCAKGEVPGAVKLPDGGWQIPADAMRIKPLPGTDTATRRDNVADVADTTTRRDDVGVTLAATLSLWPAFLTLEQASRVLGIPQSAIRRGRDRFEVEPVGENGALMVPQRVVREIAGI